MPGSVSDAYDPEFGTAANAAEVAHALRAMYLTVSRILADSPPMPIVELVHMPIVELVHMPIVELVHMPIVELVHKNLPGQYTPTLTEKQWRIIRFAPERTGESI